MEGLGNDFVVVSDPRDLSPAGITALCDRRRGVGADGVLVVSAENERIGMSYFNADGSVAEMCGNGLRCVARLAVDLGMVSTGSFTVDTPVGPRRVRVGDSDVTAELGPVAVGDRRRIGGRLFHLVTVGNPHAVTWVDDVTQAPLADTGERLQRVFPAGVNVEMVAVDSPSQLSMRVWERGVGETDACGTGAVAAAAAGLSQGLTGRSVQVRLKGGTAAVELDGESSWITGPARLVYRGEWLG